MGHLENCSVLLTVEAKLLYEILNQQSLRKLALDDEFDSVLFSLDFYPQEN